MSQLSCSKIIGNLKFQSYGLKLPTKWRPRPGENASNERPVPRIVPIWFTPAAPIQSHQDSCDEIGAGFKEVHDILIDAVVFAHGLWRLQAKFRELQINGASVFGQAGCLEGPELKEQIRTFPSCAGWVAPRAIYRDVVAEAVSQSFKAWQDHVTVPGLLWYPAFAAFAGAQAPPTPNVPTSLIACPSSQAKQIVTADPMKRAMIAAMDRLFPKAENRYDAFFDAIATVLSLGFTTWLSAQQVTQVLGRGPVPSGNGPVVGGTVISSPGQFLS